MYPQEERESTTGFGEGQATLRPPKSEEWGARTFDLLDPSGNTLFVIGPVR
jgi:hypothetical protein